MPKLTYQRRKYTIFGKNSFKFSEEQIAIGHNGWIEPEKNPQNPYIVQVQFLRDKHSKEGK